MIVASAIYNRGLAEQGIIEAEAKATREQGLQKAIDAGIMSSPFFHDAVCGIVSNYAYLMPSSIYCKLADTYCAAEMKELGLYGIKYIKEKFREAQNLGMTYKDKMLLERYIYLAYAVKD